MKRELTSEEQAIVARWEHEKEARLPHWETMMQALEDGNAEAFDKAMHDWFAAGAEFCEHGKHYLIDCRTCDRLEALLGLGEHGEEFDDEELDRDA